MLDCRFRYFDGGFLLADVTVDEDEISRRFELLRLADSPRSSHHVVAVFDKCQRDSEADSTGSTRYNCHRLLCAAHNDFLLHQAVLITGVKVYAATSPSSAPR